MYVIKLELVEALAAADNNIPFYMAQHQVNLMFVSISDIPIEERP